VSTDLAQRDLIDSRIDTLGNHHFRARFRLRGRERGLANLHGPTRLREHAAEIVAKRLAPAAPAKDGRQTPYRGHPVFVAQHATATCCRTCLRKGHEIEKGRELTDDEQGYVVDVITRWIERELNR
jgi:predicted Fe-S protein YdhL (DUF1289 family)